MTHGRGAQVGDYGAPLFLAWQLTNRCQGLCLHCCEESGPDSAWADELTRTEALSLARQIAAAGVAEAAFGGGEPLAVPHVWDIFDILRAGGVALKIETNGLLIGEKEADRIKALDVETIQISLDGATAATHERVRPMTGLAGGPDGNFAGVLGALERLKKRGLEPEVVFVPTRLNINEAYAVFALAASFGARKFVTGPMMRLGRAAENWDAVAPTPEQWNECVSRLEDCARKRPSVQLAVYPWDIVAEIRARRESPQAMMLVVPNGKVKLLNALPFSCADLRRQTLADAWAAYQTAWSHPDVQDFTRRVQKDPALLRHANECWDLGPARRLSRV